MNSKELAQKAEIERALDKRITQKEAALRLEISERQVRRWIQSYRREGVSGIVSKRRGRPSNRKTDQVQKEAVLRFIKDEQMKGFGPTFMAEKLEQLKGIKLSKETMRRFMLEAGVWKAILPMGTYVNAISRTQVFRYPSTAIGSAFSEPTAEKGT